MTLTLSAHRSSTLFPEAGSLNQTQSSGLPSQLAGESYLLLLTLELQMVHHATWHLHEDPSSSGPCLACTRTTKQL
jgi:hypothetical protein